MNLYAFFMAVKKGLKLWQIVKIKKYKKVLIFPCIYIYACWNVVAFYGCWIKNIQFCSTQQEHVDKNMWWKVNRWHFCYLRKKKSQEQWKRLNRDFWDSNPQQLSFLLLLNLSKPKILLYIAVSYVIKFLSCSVFLLNNKIKFKFWEKFLLNSRNENYCFWI